MSDSSSEEPLTLERPTWVGGTTPVARLIARPIIRFINLEVASGIVLLVATGIALIWVNSPASESYHELWATTIDIEIGSFHFEETLEEFVNDGLMALFFFVVGLEIKRELVTGQLRTARAAGLPAIAAAGGMVVPALLYVVLNIGGDGLSGWGVPMATDIAFAVGVVALVSRHVHPGLKLFLLALAIVDDIGAIAVIAVFYTDDLSLKWLALAAAGLAAMPVMRRFRVWSPIPYAMLGLFVWYATLESGVHATIAGVAIGLLTPARPLLSRADTEAIAIGLADGASADEVRHAAFNMQESVSVAERWESLLHPWTSFVVIPVFALANAGIELSSKSLSDAMGSTVTWGVLLGLVVGKPVGVLAASYLGTRLGFPLPRGLDRRQMAGLGAAAGIGFTVSIFISGLAFDDPALIDEAKIGILAASLVAAALALALLTVGRRGAVARQQPDGPATDPVFDDELELGDAPTRA